MRSSKTSRCYKCWPCGMVHKCTKSAFFTDWLQSVWNELYLPGLWWGNLNKELEMFFIYTSPLSHHSNIQDYALHPMHWNTVSLIYRLLVMCKLCTNFRDMTPNTLNCCMYIGMSNLVPVSRLTHGLFWQCSVVIATSWHSLATKITHTGSPVSLLPSHPEWGSLVSPVQSHVAVKNPVSN